MPKKVIFLYNPEQIDIVLSYFGKDVFFKQKNLEIVGLDYQIEIELKHRNIPYHSFQKYLRPDSFQNLTKKATQFVDQWIRLPEMKFFQYDEIKLGEIVGLEIIRYIRLILYYLEAFVYFFEKHPEIEEVLIPQLEISVPKTAGPVAPFTERVVVDVAKLVGELKNVKVKVLFYEKKSPLKEKIKNIINKLLYLVFNFGLKIINFLVSITQSPKKLKIFVIDYWRNVGPFLKKMEDVELVMLERKEIKKMGWEIWRKRTRFYHRRDFINRKIKEIARAKKNEFQSKWQEVQDKPIFSEIFFYQNVSFWPIFKLFLDDLVTNWAEDIISEIESIKRMLIHFSINRILLRATAKDHFYLTSKLAQKLKISSIELQHGIAISDNLSWNYSPIKVDYFAVYGKLTKEMLVRNQEDPERIVVIGSPRFDRYLEKEKGENLDLLREKLKINPSHPLILLNPPTIINSFVLPGDFTTYEIKELLQILKKLQEDIKGLQVLVKFRPTTIDESVHRKIITDILKENLIIAHYEDTKSLISLSDIVLSYKSTIILEAMIIGKPVILFTLGKGASQFQLFEEAGALRIANTLEELLEHIRSLLSDEEARKDLVKNANAFLKKYYLFDGKSSERIIKLLNEGKI